MLTFAVETTTYNTYVPGFTCELFLAREGTFRNCLNNLRRSGCDCVAAFTHPSHIVHYAPGDSFNRALSRAERLDYLFIWQFLKVSAIYSLSLGERVRVRGTAPPLITYALRCSSIDLIWPMARVGFSPLGHTLTQFMMLWQRNTLKASLNPSRRLSVSVSRLSIRKR